MSLRFVSNSAEMLGTDKQAWRAQVESVGRNFHKSRGRSGEPVYWPGS